MKKQVPKDVDLQTQYDQLLHRLAGNEAFGRRRGKMSFALSTIQKLAKKAKTPTEFKDFLDVVLGDIRSQGMIYAQLLRDGCSSAAAELILALKDKSHVLPGETVPIEQTAPWVLLVPDPKRTFQMIKFMLLGDHSEFSRHAGVYTEQWRKETEGKWSPRIYAPKLEQIPETSSVLAEILQSFPSLVEISMRYGSTCKGDYFYAAWVTDVLSQFPNFVDSSGEKLGQTFPMSGKRRMFPAGSQFLKHFGGQDAYDVISLENPPRVYAGFGGYAVGGWGFLIPGKYEQVLSCISREDKDRFAYWALDVPSALMEQGDGYWPTFGFHSDTEHDYWRHQRPSLVSHGVSHGWGTMLLDNMPEYQTVFCEQDGYSKPVVREGLLRFTMSATY